MMAAGEVKVNDVIDSNGGRPAKQFCYNAEYEYKLCIFEAVTDKINTIHYVLCDALGNEVESDDLKEEIIDEMVLEDVISEIIKRHPQITLIGIGLPGIISNGVVREPDIKNLNGLELGKIIQEKFNVYVQVGNDLNYMVYGL